MMSLIVKSNRLKIWNPFYLHNMARTIENDLVDQHTIELLNRLIDKKLSSAAYANVLYELGLRFGTLISDRIGSLSDAVSLVCTVEDADNLAKGIVEVLEKKGRKVALTVFWNKRFKPNKENDISVAPILREFHDEGYKDARVLIVIKSIIVNSCVVRTNLTKLIDESDPERILVVAPVLLEGATKKLENEFDSVISKKLEYLYFAVDSEKTAEGYVDPGIGGNVYERLGFGAQDGKNRFTPTIVKQRRQKSA